MPTTRPADDAAIREQAYYFWEQDGKPDGRETEYWMRALVALGDTSQPKKKAAASKAKSAPAKAEAVKKPKKK